MSRIGKKPIEIPKEVKVKLEGSVIVVEGPNGKLDYVCPARLKTQIKDSSVFLQRSSDSKTDKSLQGMARTLINNMITGVTKGFSKELEIRGVGYRAQVEGKTLRLQLGFSHPIIYNIPQGIEIKTPKPTQLIISGIDKVAVGQAAANIREFYKAEPYKGKGIRYLGEYVRHKAGKQVVK